MRHLSTRIAALASVALASGCSGGSFVPGSPARVLATAAPVATSAPVSSAARTGTLTFSIAVPGRNASAAAHRRMPAYVSASTAKVQIAVQGQNEAAPEAPQTFACTSVCTGSFSAPAGVDRIVLQLQDASGKALSNGVSTVIVIANQSNTFAFTLDGVVASVDIGLTSAKLPVVPAANGYVLFNARDADGNIITYDGAYADANDAPLVFDLTSSDPNFVLSSTTVSGPGSLVPYAYDGASHVGTIVLTAKLHAGTSSANAPTFAPASIALVPGILERIDPPQPLTVNGVTQMPLTFLDGKSATNLISGTAASGATLFEYSFATGTYGDAVVSPKASTLMAGAPVVAYGTMDGTLSADGLSGYLADGSETYTSFGETQSGLANGSTDAASPCTGLVPLGQAEIGQTGGLFCEQSNQSGDAVFERLSGGNYTLIAQGQPIKILVDGSTVYVQTSDLGAPQVWSANSLFANAVSLGMDVTAIAAPYLGRSDGTVVQAGSATPVATFSAPVTAIVASLPSFYALEGRVFGYARGGVVRETDPLPIGVPFDLMTAPGRPPIIVEADGTLDVMAI